MIKKVQVKLKFLIGKALHSLKRRLKRNQWVAHNGLQRNGTNYLLLCLKSLKLDVINEFDPQRNHPSHKHFRWYKNKGSVPNFINNEYFNTNNASSVEEINKIAGYPRDTVHVVIRKDRDSAVVSLANWGLGCGWFENKEHAIKSFQELEKDYDAYYEYWRDLSEKEPRKVVIVQFEEIVKDGHRLAEALDSVGIKIRTNVSNFSFNEVPMSPQKRQKIIDNSDYERWKSNLSPIEL